MPFAMNVSIFDLLDTPREPVGGSGGPLPSSGGEVDSVVVGAAAGLS